MFGWNIKKNDALRKRVDELEQHCVNLGEIRNRLEDHNAELTAENKKLQQKKQMEDEMIAHKLKMREESVELNAEKRISEAERNAEKMAQDKIAEVKDEYRDKLENQLEKRGDELKSMYEEVLTRLPDVSMAISKEIKEKTKS